MFLCISPPVSYTHLDVYKRQSYRRRRTVYKFAGRVRRGCAEAAFLAVLPVKGGIREGGRDVRICRACAAADGKQRKNICRAQTAGMLVVPGMVLTIEPMVNMGRDDILIDGEDGWTVTTTDGLPSAQWEIQVLVTETGYEVLAY